MRNMVVSNCLEIHKRGKKRERWPVMVQIGNVRVPIYRDRYSKAGRLYDRYTVVHYQTDGTTRTRQREYFTSLEDARFEAQRIAAAIANGEADALKLKSADRESYLHAIAELKPLGIPLHVAVSEYMLRGSTPGPALSRQQKSTRAGIKQKPFTCRCRKP